MTQLNGDDINDFHNGLCDLRIKLATLSGQIQGIVTDLDILRDDLASVDDDFVGAVVRAQIEEGDDDDA